MLIAKTLLVDYSTAECQLLCIAQYKAAASLQIMCQTGGAIKERKHDPLKTLTIDSALKLQVRLFTSSYFIRR